MNINEIREYLTEISPQWMFEDETEEWSVERQISNEHPRCVDFRAQPCGAIHACIYTEGVFNARTLHFLPVVTRAMLDEAVHWEETGEAPEWFPEGLKVSSAILLAERKVNHFTRELNKAVEALRIAREVLANQLTEKNK